MSARQAWLDLVVQSGSDHVAEESAIIAIGREFLPPCAREVLDGGEPSEAYWSWLYAQTAEGLREIIREARADWAAEQAYQASLPDEVRS